MEVHFPSEDASAEQFNQYIDGKALRQEHMKRLDPTKLHDISDEEAYDILHTWELWARPNQLEPDAILPNGEHWTTWLILAGRGFGKTRTGAETVIQWVKSGVCKRIALVAEDSADARDVMVEGESGILACSSRDFMPKYEPSKRRLTWPNGAVATLFSAEDYDSLRGPQFDGAWCDELCVVAGTMVQTEVGPRPIEEVKVGDLVWTREGLKRVKDAGKTKENAELWTNGYITGTHSHPVWTTAGYRRLTDLLIGDTVAVWQNLFYTADGNSIVGAESIRTVKADSCLESCGKTLTGRSRPATTFTIETKTPIITSSTTLSSLLGRSMSYDTNQGALLAKTPSGERTILESLCGISGNRVSFDVPNVVVSSSPPGCEQNIVIPIVRLEQIAVSEKLEERADVYNLEVEDCNEFFANGLLVHNCKWRYAQEAWDNLQFGLRLGEHPRQIVTTTPRPQKLLKDILLRSDTAVTKGNTTENLANLATPFLKAVVEKYAGTRIGRQELNAEILDDVPGALWSRSLIEKTRIRPDNPEEKIKLPHFKRVIISVDPAKELSDSKKKSEHKDRSVAETGIIVVGLDARGHGYVLEDLSMMGTPEEWGAQVVRAYDDWDADKIVYEANQGGEMVAAVIRGAAKGLREQEERETDFVPLKAVHASRGKIVRAEPVSQLYEQEKIHHVGTFAELEDQLCEYTPDGTMGYSPDRMDALVWGFTELMVGSMKGGGMFEYYRLQAEKSYADEAEALRRVLRGETVSLPSGDIPLKAPMGINTAFGADGTKFVTDEKGLIYVKQDDVKGLTEAGWQRDFSLTAA